MHGLWIGSTYERNQEWHSKLSVSKMKSLRLSSHTAIAVATYWISQQGIPSRRTASWWVPWRQAMRFPNWWSIHHAGRLCFVKSKGNLSLGLQVLQFECALCPTRWTVHADLMESTIKNYCTLQTLWEQAVDIVVTQRPPHAEGFREFRTNFTLHRTQRLICLRLCWWALLPLWIQGILLIAQHNYIYTFHACSYKLQLNGILHVSLVTCTETALVAPVTQPSVSIAVEHQPLRNWSSPQISQRNGECNRPG